METPGNQNSASPIKQNSPDEEIARAAAHEITTELIFDEHAMAQIILTALRESKAGQVAREGGDATCPNQVNSGSNAAPVVQSDSVAAGQEEEETVARAGNHDCEYESEKEDAMCIHCGLTSGEAIKYFEKRLEGKEAVADHAQAVLQNALKALLKSWSTRRDNIETATVGTMDYRKGLGDATGDCQTDLEELLSSQGVSSTAAGVSYPKCPECKGTQFHHSRCRTRPPLTPPSPQVEQVSAVQESLRDETPSASTQGHDQIQKFFVYLRVADKILKGSEHGAIRWHGPDARNQWCWQYRNVKDIAIILSENFNVAGADQVSENPCAVQGEWRVEEHGKYVHLIFGGHRCAFEVERRNVPEVIAREYNASLKDKDSARLDWLDQQREPISLDGETLLAYLWQIEAQNHTIRDAIDAAMSVPLASEVEEEKEQDLEELDDHKTFEEATDSEE